MQKQIKYGAIIAYVALFINVFIGVFYTPWMIKSIGKADYGLYTLAMSVISFFMFDFGLSKTITRFIAKYRAEQNQHKIDNFLGLTYRLYLSVNIVVLLILIAFYFYIPSIYKGLSYEELEKFKVVFIIAASFSVISFPCIPFAGILNAYENFIQLKICDLLQKISVVVLMTFCLLQGRGLYALVAVNAFTGIVAVICKLLIILKCTPIVINWRYWDNSELRSLIKFSTWITIMAFTQRCVVNISPSILGALSSSESIAVFGVAMTIESYTYLFANAINGMFLPKVSRLVNNKNRNALLELMIKVGRFQIFIIALLYIGFISVGKEFIENWVGDDYSIVYYCVLLLLFPSVICLPQEIANSAIVAEDKVKYQAYINITKSIINIILAIPLAKSFGALGLSISIFIAYMVEVVLSNIVYYRILHINISEFFSQTFITLLPQLILSLILSYFVCSFAYFEAWLDVLTKTLLCIIIYILCIGPKLSNSEKELIKSLVKK